MGEARGEEMRVPIVRASAISKALGRRGPVLEVTRKVGTVTRFEKRAAAMVDKDRVVDSGGPLLCSDAESSDLGWLRGDDDGFFFIKHLFS